MGKQSGLMKKHSQEIDAYANAYKNIIQQFDVDTLCIAVNQCEGLGFQRIMRLLEVWRQVRQELYPAIDPKDPLCDVKQEHMDRALQRICKGHMEIIPHKERYPNIKGVSYGSRQKGGR